MCSYFCATRLILECQPLKHLKMFQQASFAFSVLQFCICGFSNTWRVLHKKLQPTVNSLGIFHPAIIPFFASFWLSSLPRFLTPFMMALLNPPFLSASRKLPGPHEVVFYSETEDSPGVMLWRYPEPRVLTFVRITPVPFNTTEDPEISTADLSDVLQVEADTRYVNVFYSHYSKNTSLSNGCLNEFEKQVM